MKHFVTILWLQLIIMQFLLLMMNLLLMRYFQSLALLKQIMWTKAIIEPTNTWRYGLKTHLMYDKNIEGTTHKKLYCRSILKQRYCNGRDLLICCPLFYFQVAKKDGSFYNFFSNHVLFLHFHLIMLPMKDIIKSRFSMRKLDCERLMF